MDILDIIRKQWTSWTLTKTMNLSTVEQKKLASNIKEAIYQAFSKPCPNSKEQVLADKLAGRTFTPKEKEKLVIESLKSSFIARHKLLQNSLTGSDVQQMLGLSSRMSHINRVNNKTLLAVKDNGVWKFPAWQFDAEGNDSVINGLPKIIEALEMSDIAKISWFNTPNSHLEGRTPLEMLKKGEIRAVVNEAKGVGVS
jgi:hypothetical protein